MSSSNPSASGEGAAPDSSGDKNPWLSDEASGEMIRSRFPILRVVSKLLIPYILLFACYVQFHGDFGPGGGFQAGVIFAAAVILYSLVFGLEEARRAFRPRVIDVLIPTGVLLYAGTGVWTMLAGGAFLDYNALEHAAPKTREAGHEAAPVVDGHGAAEALDLDSHNTHSRDVGRRSRADDGEASGEQLGAGETPAANHAHFGHGETLHGDAAHGDAAHGWFPHGQHLGIFLVELGVGVTVAAVMIAIFFAFAARGAAEPSR